jgi:hypothetical protein
MVRDFQFGFLQNLAEFCPFCLKIGFALDEPGFLDHLDRSLTRPSGCLKAMHHSAERVFYTGREDAHWGKRKLICNRRFRPAG